MKSDTFTIIGKHTNKGYREGSLNSIILTCSYCQLIDIEWKYIKESRHH